MKNEYEPSAEEIQALVDGELSPQAAALVRASLAHSPGALAELDECLQMAALAHALREQAAAPQRWADLARPQRPPDSTRDIIPFPGRRRARARIVVSVVASLSLCAAAALAWWTTMGGQGRDRASVVAGAQAAFAAALAPRRAIDVRLSWPAADRYRPYDTARAGGEYRAETLSFDLLARVEKLGDARAVSAAQLLLGHPAQAAPAAGKDRSADADSDRAAIALATGKPEDAVLAAASALRSDPRHVQATWNRALALERLGMPLTAADAFEAVASRKEPGWSKEATERAAALRAGFERRKAAWKALNEGGAKLVAGGDVDATIVATYPDRIRSYFYDAVRAAASPGRVRALRPLALTLDAHFGGSHLASYVDRIARADFRRRGPLAARYAVLARRQMTDRAQVQALLAALRRAGQDDMLLGALVHGGATPGQVDERSLSAFVALARATGDPWLELFAEEQRGMVVLTRDEISVAHSVLEAAAARCDAPGVDYPCQRIFRLLTFVYVALHRPEAAQRSYDRARRLARATGSVALENELLWFAHLAVGVRDDISAGWLPLSEAYLDEWGRHDVDCAAAHLARESVAMMLVNQNRLDEARRHLAGGTFCEPPFTAHRAFVLANLLPDSGDDGAVRALRSDIAARRDAADLRPGERAFLDHAEGQLLIKRAPVDGRALLRRAIAAGESHADDIDAIKARRYSYAVLVDDAAAREASAEVLDLLAEERGLPAPARCALGASDDGAAVFAARTADGASSSVRLTDSPGVTSRARPVPQAIRSALAGCESIDVFARQPFYGRPDLLPRHMAWQFRTEAPARERAPKAGRQVVVANIDPPAGLDLAPLRPVSPVADEILIEGPAATPARVLSAAADASYLEIHAHGLLGGTVSETSLLVLAADARGRYALDGDEIRQARLRAAPVVVLASCNASAIGSAFHSTWGLADAFAAAGARAVIASPDPIQDAGAPGFFAALRARIAAGQTPEIALRDERMLRTDPGERAWIDRLVVFR